MENNKELQLDSWVDLKFIMANTGFKKTFIYERIKDGTLEKPYKIYGRSRWKYSALLEFKKRLLSE
ncbi:helix-turn-helix transcriptional regulator [Xenorhabdus stockiae]|uniref:helix-turn-helix transcriptional regulator n=1 Tax=Xenorhabdus stockiae TaxID=351614 RepID=UPI003CE6CDA5